MGEQYYIWSNEHRAWWRANRSGYAESIEAAGLYSRDEAIQICALGRDGWEAHSGPAELPVPEGIAQECIERFRLVMAQR